MTDDPGVVHGGGELGRSVVAPRSMVALRGSIARGDCLF